ncbi:zinc ribbon domain-containing protein [Butyrivibrio sp. TB]|uniref:zinc ribbon domain-containing protein n=1 Tax=Butyrivibrio sp. TB TaxID=1520809 RepID=UPI0008D28FD7|nr:zinc ribbon domain-containing protein [Butyrivibrio sp. TB]SEP62415.1 zinc-ribbon domain-containing protein [Butyrivibrio sp. TB]
MALINCPECGKEISNQALACPNCGYPIRDNNTPNTSGINVSREIDRMYSLIDDFDRKPPKTNDIYKSLSDILPVITRDVNSVRRKASDCSDEERTIIEDKIAAVILEATSRCTGFGSWISLKAYYELVDFDSISEKTMKEIADWVFSELTDSENGHINIILLWYPTYQIINHASESIKKPIEEYLNSTGKMENITSSVERHLNDSVAVQEAVKTASIVSATVNVSKCPTCGSINITKISSLSRFVSTGLFGIGSKKIGKTFKCSNCGYMW